MPADSYAWSLEHPTRGARLLTAATKRRVTFRRRAPADATFEISGRHDEAGYIDELVTNLLIRRGTDLIFRGRVGPTTDKLTADRHDVTVTIGDYAALLDRRIVYDGELADPFTGFDIGVLAAFLVTYAQGQYAGDLGIADGHAGPFPDGSNIPAGIVAPDISFPPGKSIAACLNLLSQTGLIDWQIDAEPKIVVYPNGRYRPTDTVLDFGGAITNVDRTVDPGTYANAGRFTGTDALPPEKREVADIFVAGAHPEGRFDLQYGDPDIVDAAILASTADAEIGRRSIILPAYDLTLTPGFWKGPAHIWPGDIVTLAIVSRPRLDVLVDIVVEALTINLADTGTETIVATVGWNLPNPLQRQADNAARIRDLERR